MTRLPTFQVCAGSVIGTDHIRIGRPNQDAFHYDYSDDYAVYVVCDGCGDLRCAHSEFGAMFGARVAAASLLRRVSVGGITKEALAGAFHDILELTRSTAYYMHCASETFDKVIYNNFLFTIVACVIGRETSCFLAVGDGVVIINGEVIDLGPFPNNAPPFIAYNLLGQATETEFKVVRTLPTEELDSFLIGTDGVRDLIKFQGELLPHGRGEVGPISQFWDMDTYYNNPLTVSRRLRVINTDHMKIDWDRRGTDKAYGLLGDDTTLFAGRRYPRPTIEGS